MKENPANPYTTHHAVLMELPWYVNKTLRDSEMEAVENHLKVCLTCKREMVTLQKLALAVSKTDVLESAAQVSFSRIKNRIHQAEKAGLNPSVQNTGRFYQWYQKLGSGSFNVFQPAATLAFAALILFVLTPGYFVTATMPKNDFRTLSSGENASLDRNEIKVVFRKGVSRQQIDKIAGSVHGKVTGEPTSEGIYLIRVEQKTVPEDIFNSVSSLRNNSDVIFAEPAYALLSSAQSSGVSK